jgi:broad specificity phosphatase PhoE
VVAELARILGIYLKQAGFSLNLDLIVACGYLHELACGKSDRSGEGANILDEAGYTGVARILASHTDIRPEKGPVDEADLVRFADKLVIDDRMVTLEAQFNHLLENFSGRPRTLKPALRELRDAEKIQARIEAILGICVDEIIQKHRRGILAASPAEKRQIYLASHGEIRFEAGKECVIPRWSSPLSDEGIKQARALEERLRCARLSAIYCSDIRCVMETAWIIGKPHGLHPIEVRNFREIAFGKWERLKVEDISHHYLKDCAEKAEDIVHYQPPGGESLLDCTLRVIPALYSILHSSRGNILIVGHPLLNRILLSQAMGKSLGNLFEIDQAYGCLNVIRYSDFSFDVKVLNEICLPGLEENA